MDKLTDDVDLQNFSSQCYLLDLHSNNPSPSTYIGSSNRWIDHMFGCRKISDSMTSSGSLSYLEGPQSDHRGLFVDLNPLILMRDAIAPMSIAAYHTRMLKAGNPELVELYQSSMKKYDKEHNMTERLDALHKNRQKMSPTAIRILLEKWDSDQGRAMKQAEKQLSRTAKCWSDISILEDETKRGHQQHGFLFNMHTNAYNNKQPTTTYHSNSHYSEFLSCPRKSKLTSIRQRSS